MVLRADRAQQLQRILELVGRISDRRVLAVHADPVRAVPITANAPDGRFTVQIDYALHTNPGVDPHGATLARGHRHEGGERGDTGLDPQQVAVPLDQHFAQKGASCHKQREFKRHAQRNAVQDAGQECCCGDLRHLPLFVRRKAGVPSAGRFAGLDPADLRRPVTAVRGCGRKASQHFVQQCGVLQLRQAIAGAADECVELQGAQLGSKAAEIAHRRVRKIAEDIHGTVLGHHLGADGRVHELRCLHGGRCGENPCHLFQSVAADHDLGQRGVDRVQGLAEDRV